MTRASSSSSPPFLFFFPSLISSLFVLSVNFLLKIFELDFNCTLCIKPSKILSPSLSRFSCTLSSFNGWPLFFPPSGPAFNGWLELHSLNDSLEWKAFPSTNQFQQQDSTTIFPRKRVEQSCTIWRTLDGCIICRRLLLFENRSVSSVHASSSP